MAIKIYPLKSVIELFAEHEVFERAFLEVLSKFRCKHNNTELNEFLQNQAIGFEKRNLARTYIAYGDNPRNIIGYFTIGIKSVDLNETSQKNKKLVASDDRMNHATVFLLAHIGEIEDCALERYALLNIALKYIKSAQEIIGGRAVYLDVKKDNEKLFNYYCESGFTLMSERGSYKQMVMKL